MGTRKWTAPDLDGVPLHPETLMMSYGYRPEWSEGAVKPPIFPASTYVFKTAEEGKEFFATAYGLREAAPDEPGGLIYGRINHPGLEILEDRLCLWEGAESCAVFESGMAAITATFLTYLQPGDILLHSEPLYGGTDHFIHEVLHRFGVHSVGVPANADAATIRRALEASQGDRLGMIYLESPANPTNAIADIAMFAEFADQHRLDARPVPLAVDNTFLGPLFQHPLKHGADLVLYSATKYIGGHSDAIAGACLGSAQMVEPVRAMRTFTGSMGNPWTSWLLLRSLETLQMRMTRQADNARILADFLLTHPKVERVYYLGHIEESDPQYNVYRRQCTSAGAMISFDVVGGEAEAFRCLNALKVIKLAVSLGGTESLAQHPATMTHAGVSVPEQQRMGISSQLIRFSVGVEHPDDLRRDLKQALDAI